MSIPASSSPQIGSSATEVVSVRHSVDAFGDPTIEITLNDGRVHNVWGIPQEFHARIVRRFGNGGDVLDLDDLIADLMGKPKIRRPEEQDE